MPALSGHDIVELWEQGERLTPADRPLRLLAYAYPELSAEELVSFSVGERDRLVLQIRESLSGQEMDGYSICPACGQDVEFQVRTSDLLALPPADSQHQTLQTNDFEVTYRLPNSGDAAALAGTDSLDDARQELLRRCLLTVRRAGADVSIDAIPASVVEALEAAMETEDPLADVGFDLTCPACAHAWSTTFDPASFLWSELAVHAQRLLQDVHTLATHYGWREADILGMSSRRRTAYMEMIG